MPGELTPENLRAYRDRAWDLIQASKERFRAEDAQRGGPPAGRRASEALWLHARAVDPTWPGQDVREADLEHHIRLAGRIERLSHVFAGR